jgi:CRP-like cAMP-binding protein
MQDALIRKLESYETLSEQEHRALDALSLNVRTVPARTDLVQEGDAPERMHLILDGFACRYKILPNGERQIMAFFVPGDFCDLNVFILDAMDHSIGTISSCHVAEVPRSMIDEITAQHPRITRAFWWCTLVDEAVLREWLVNLGGRQADQRIAHLLCELLMRLGAVGCASDDSFAFPFKQVDLADCMGLSDVHVNRTLRELRERGLVTLKQRIITIHDVDRLKAYCGFNPNYLHLTNARWRDRRIAPWLVRTQGG